MAERIGAGSHSTFNRCFRPDQDDSLATYEFVAPGEFPVKHGG